MNRKKVMKKRINTFSALLLAFLFVVTQVTGCGKTPSGKPAGEMAGAAAGASEPWIHTMPKPSVSILIG